MLWNFTDPFYVFNILNSPLRNHEKIQSLGCFFWLRVYYRVINNKNLELQVQNTCYLITGEFFRLHVYYMVNFN